MIMKQCFQHLAKHMQEREAMLSRHLIDKLEINIADLTFDHAVCFDIDIFSIEELGLWNDISTEIFVSLLFDAALINSKQKTYRKFLTTYI